MPRVQPAAAAPPLSEAWPAATDVVPQPVLDQGIEHTQGDGSKQPADAQTQYGRFHLRNGTGPVDSRSWVHLGCVARVPSGSRRIRLYAAMRIGLVL